jgi:hypothetical protein
MNMADAKHATYECSMAEMRKPVHEYGGCGAYGIRMQHGEDAA